MKLGLIGKPLGHSKSPRIHKELTGAEYSLWELEPEELDAFFAKRDFDGLNVTIPYKLKVLEYMDELQGDAVHTGAVNTVLNRGGRLIGCNTDVFGAKCLIRSLGIAAEGKRAAVLGSGGAARAAAEALRQLGAEPVIVSRAPEKTAGLKDLRIISYDALYKAPQDIAILVNATPLGMSPHTDGMPIDLDKLPDLAAVADVVANPLRTRLVFEAQQRGLKAAGGLRMLVAQAFAAEELFTGKELDSALIDRVTEKLADKSRNIVLTGMPSAGKTNTSRLLAQKTGLPFLDMDEELEKRFGIPIAQYFREFGEASFRTLEKQLAAELALLEGHIIATGGGTVLDPENMRRLMANGCAVWLDRNLALLEASAERPLAADTASIERLWNERRETYRKYSDVRVEADGSPEDTVQELMKLLTEEKPC